SDKTIQCKRKKLSHRRSCMLGALVVKGTKRVLDDGTRGAASLRSWKECVRRASRRDGDPGASAHSARRTPCPPRTVGGRVRTVLCRQLRQRLRPDRCAVTRGVRCPHPPGAR